MTSPSPANGGGVPSPRRNNDGHAAGGGARSPSGPAGDESPGVPVFRTWRGVYLFVLACFLAMVAGLTVFTEYFK